MVEIDAAIEEQITQKRLLESDLRDVLLGGEDTRPYRAAIADVEKTIGALKMQKERIREAEANRRHAEIAITAREQAEGARRRFSALMDSLMPPAHPIENGIF